MSLDAEPMRSVLATSSISSFSTLPSEASIRFIDRRGAPRRLTDAPAAAPEMSGIDDLNLVVGVTCAESPKAPTKTKSFVHAVKKAGSRAARKLASRSWGRHPRPDAPTDVRVVFLDAEENSASTESTNASPTASLTVLASSSSSASGRASNASSDSLTAVHGSPPSPALPLFLSSPPPSLYDLARAPSPLDLDDLDSPAPRSRTARALLLLPHTALAGALPFVAPEHLTRFTNWSTHAVHAPWHAGVALGLLLVLLRALAARIHPFAALAALLALLARVAHAWRGFDRRDHGDARAHAWGVLCALVRAAPPPDVWAGDAHDDGGTRPGSEAWEPGEDEGVLEALARMRADAGAALDVVIRLKDRPHEYLRIVVDCEDNAGGGGHSGSSSL